MCPGVTGDAEQRGSAAAGRPSVDGSLYQGHGSAGSGRSAWLYTITSPHLSRSPPGSDKEPLQCNKIGEGN